MTDLEILFIGFAMFILGGIVGGLVHKSHDRNSVTFEDCKEIKIDTISYNYRDSTYVLQVDVKY